MTEPAVDLSRIKFPSDRLAVHELRKLWPHAFDTPSDRQEWRGHVERAGSLEDTLGALITCERTYAALVFRHALGIPLPEGGEP